MELKFRAWHKERMNIRKGSKGMYKQNGYTLAKAEYHPHANSRGYVPLHRLLIENELGRYLIPRKELVHHIDGDRSNNDLTNLKLTTPRKHKMEEHFEGRTERGHFKPIEPIFNEMKLRLYDRDKKITQFYTMNELIYTSYRRGKFKYRGSFTGLKDKNGKEIYVGDILKCVDEYTTIGVLEYATNIGTYIVRYTRDGDYYYSPLNRGDISRGLQLQETEVIGNIHQNGEQD